MQLTFEDNETIINMLDRWCAGAYVVAIIAPGQDGDYQLVGTEYHDSGLVVVGRLWDDENGAPHGELVAIPYEAITAIHVY